MRIKCLFIAAALIFISCTAQRSTFIEKVDALGNQNIEDSVIRNLQLNNDLVIAYAIENFAWVRSIRYFIVAQKNGVWSGYRYYVNLMPNSPQPNSFERIDTISKSSCDSLLRYTEQNHAWSIKGDSGQNFCRNGSTGCNIYDAGGARLWFVTPKGVANPYYYAPEFFQQCCPDNERALFVAIMHRIENIVSQFAPAVK